MGRKRALVRWQDGSTNAGYEHERYQEKAGKDYWSFMTAKAPFGFDENGQPKESGPANPDVMSDEEYERLSGNEKGNAQPSAEQILLEEAKALLTEKQAAVWQAVMIEEYTEAEAADVMGVSQPAVHKHLSVARKKITEYLQANAHRIKRD